MHLWTMQEQTNDSAGRTVKPDNLSEQLKYLSVEPRGEEGTRNTLHSC